MGHDAGQILTINQIKHTKRANSEQAPSPKPAAQFQKDDKPCDCGPGIGARHIIKRGFHLRLDKVKRPDRPKPCHQHDAIQQQMQRRLRARYGAARLSFCAGCHNPNDQCQGKASCTVELGFHQSDT